MATMPKCSGPTCWTRGTSCPLGFCRTKALRVLPGRAVRGRGMLRFFREEEWYTLHPKGKAAGRIENCFSANPHTTAFAPKEFRARLESASACGLECRVRR